MTTATQKQLGQENTERVREWFLTHLCGTNRECALALRLSEMTVGKHVKKIRDEWRLKR